MIEANGNAALANPLVPRHRLRCFDRDALDSRRQHAVTVLLILLREQLHARHANRARSDSLLCERVLCRENDGYLGSARHQHHFGLATTYVGQYVGTARDVARGRILAAVDERQFLSSEYQTYGSPELERRTPCFRRFICVRGSDDSHVWDRAQVGKLFDRLMCRPILAESDRIVRVHIYDTLPHHARESHGRPHVVAEYQERRAVRNYAAIQRHSIHDATHTVLAYSEMEVATLVTSRPETRRTLHYRVCRAGEIRRSTDQLRKLRCDRVDHSTGCRSCCNAAVLRIERWNQIFPAIREVTARASLEFSAQVRVRSLPLIIQSAPCRLFVRAGESRASPECKRVWIDVERLL